jgi:hypothetical protein
MSHGIGIEDGGPVAFRTAYTGAFSPELLLELLADYRQSSPPRPFRYGNLGYNILGLVLDSRQGHGWKDVVRREVLDPLGMRDTSARVSDFESDVIALPHDYGADGKFRRIRLGKADANMHAAGGHFATSRDLARFVAAHASGGRLDGVQVFPRELIASAHRKHIDQDRRFGPFRRFGWGYGWDLGTYGDVTIVHRFGAFPGYRSHMSFMPDRGTGVVVLVNGGGPASDAADVVATYIYDRLSSRPNLAAAYKLRVRDLQAIAATTGVDLYVVSTVDERPVPQRLLQTAANESSARVSPDGRWVAYVSDESGQGEVYVSRFPEMQGQRMVSSGGGTRPFWRRDGMELFFLAPKGRVMSVAVTFGPATIITGKPLELFKTMLYGEVYTPSADGERFLTARPVPATDTVPLEILTNRLR